MWQFMKISSMDIARLIGETHAALLIHIGKKLNQANLRQTEFLVPHDDKGHYCFFLPRKECDYVMAEYSQKQQQAIRDWWDESND
jgi:hypothetical protein